MGLSIYGNDFKGAQERLEIQESFSRTNRIKIGAKA
jgi:hypothetical protein